METTIPTTTAPRKSTDARNRTPGPPDVGVPPGERLWWAAMAVVAAAGLVRLGLAAAVPLVPDEAYYWEWSRRLASGYFDHPPLIALLIAAGTSLFGDSALGVRFFPVLFGTVAMGLVADLAGRHGGPRAALIAAVVAAVVPMSAVGLVLATPDVPLLFGLAAALAAIDRALAAAPGSRSDTRWWLVAGVALGIGMVGKYSAGLLPVSVLLAFAAVRALRPRLSTPGPYLAALTSLLIFLPVVVWNARHGWISFAFQLNHGFGSGGRNVLDRQLEFLGGQVGLISPILLVMMGIVVASVLTRGGEPRRTLLAVVASATFAVFVYSGMTQRVQPNWPAPAYLPGFVLLAAVAGGVRWRRWRRGGIMLAALMTTLIYLHTLRPFLPLAPNDDPVAQAFGWDSLANEVAAVAEAAQQGEDGRVRVAANRYQDAAQLAFNLPGHPTVYALNLAARPNQYDLWPGFAATAAPGDGLVLVLGDRDDETLIVERLSPHFREVSRATSAALVRHGETMDERRVWVLTDWRGSW